jgi:addiction module RelE/StbE family toxin
VAALRTLALRFNSRAISQLSAIQQYLEQRNPSAAHNVGTAIRDAAETLRYFPYAGRIGRSEGTREWVVQSYPYILVYEVEAQTANQVIVLGVFHAAQDRSSDEQS